MSASLNRLKKYKQNMKVDKLNTFIENRAWMIQMLDAHAVFPDLRFFKYIKETKKFVIQMNMMSAVWHLTTGTLTVRSGNLGSFVVVIEGKQLHDALLDGEKGMRGLKK